jgi:hypothetical protein
MNDKELVLVECFSTFKMTYLVEVDVDAPHIEITNLVHKEDNGHEFAQQYLGLEVDSLRTVTEEQVIELCDKLNPHLKEWSDKKKVNHFILRKEDE